MFLSIKKIPVVDWSSKETFNFKPKASTFSYLCFGLMLFGFGEALLVVSTLGNSPWTVLAEGASIITDLSIGVATPIERSVIIDAPSAKTVQGEFPKVETTNNASPKPNNIKPKHKYEKVEALGLKLNVSFELQSTTGIFLIDKNIFA